MNPQIIPLLMAILSLLSNPKVQNNPVIFSEVKAMDQTVMQLIDQSQVVTTTNQLASFPTSTTWAIHTIASSTPIVVTNVTQQTVGTTPILSASPTINVTPPLTTPVQISWENPRSGPKMNTGMVEGGPSQEQISSSTVAFLEYEAPNESFDSGSLVINGQTYDATIRADNGKYADFFINNASSGLESGQTYPFTLQINAGNNYATYSDSISIP